MEQKKEDTTVYLDGQPVALSYVREQQDKRTDIRIIELTEGNYKTLSRMHG
jgi:hypothetical protein